MKIVKLQAENFKRLRAVEIVPKGAVVEISGKNAQGKSSVLDSIWAAVGGKDMSPAAPIRAGENSAKVSVDLGELVVTRTWSLREDGSVDTALKVLPANGAKVTSPQHLLDTMFDKLAIDPIAFAKMPPKEQVETLRRLAPGFDWAKAEGDDAIDYDARTMAGRERKRVQAIVDSIPIPRVVVAAVDEGAIADALAKAAEHNTAIERRRAGRKAVEEEAKSIAASFSAKREQAAKLLEEANAEAANYHALLEKLAGAPPLPEPIDVAATRAALEEAKTTNALAAAQRQREEAKAQADAFTVAIGKLTGNMSAREAARRAALASIELGVSGLAFGEGGLTLNGLPFEQASQAEQLSASIAVAAAQNPKLRVMRVKEGALLDAESKAALVKFAREKDWQIWLEEVDGSGTIGVVIQDGNVVADRQ